MRSTTSSRITCIRHGLAPSKIAFLAWHAWRDADGGPLAGGLPGRRARRLRPADDHATGWSGSCYRFFQISQFKRSALPNGPKVSAGGALSPRGDWRAPSDGMARSMAGGIAAERALIGDTSQCVHQLAKRRRAHCEGLMTTPPPDGSRDRRIEDPSNLWLIHPAGRALLPRASGAGRVGERGVGGGPGARRGARRSPMRSGTARASRCSACCCRSAGWSPTGWTA